MLGDSVGAVGRWTWPSALDGLTTSDLLAVQRHIQKGQWREDIRSDAWVGKAIADVLGLDAENKADRQKTGGLQAAP